MAVHEQSGETTVRRLGPEALQTQYFHHTGVANLLQVFDYQRGFNHGMRTAFWIKTRLLGLLSLGLLLTAQPAQSQDRRWVRDDLQTWQFFSTSGHLTRRFLFYLDTQNNVVNLTNKTGNSALNNNRSTHEGQLLIRPALGFQVNKTLSVWQGYGWAPSFQPQFRNENQIWEQILLQRRFKYFQLSSRSRLEIRRIADAGGTALRFRNQFRMAVPIRKSGWSLVVFDEPFWNWNTVSNGPQKGFNQNWLFVGIDRKITDAINVQAGYLNNYVHNPYPANNRMNHVFMVSMSVNPHWAGLDLKSAFKRETLPPASGQNGSAGSRTPLAAIGDSLDVNRQTAALRQAIDQSQSPDLEILPMVTDKAAASPSSAPSAPPATAPPTEKPFMARS